jgi:hypothetical protein
MTPLPMAAREACVFSAETGTPISSHPASQIDRQA